MRLHQGQIWKQGDEYLRIVKWSRLEIEYKAMKDLSSRDGTHHTVTKKVFCRLLKGATLVPPDGAVPPETPE